MADQPDQGEYRSGHDPRTLRDALGCFATGVTVVTCLDADGEPAGLTVNSFTSVSLDPPLLLVCLYKLAASAAALAEAAHFAINVLQTGQQPASITFSTRVEDRFGRHALVVRRGRRADPQGFARACSNASVTRSMTAATTTSWSARWSRRASTPALDPLLYLPRPLPPVALRLACASKRPCWRWTSSRRTARRSSARSATRASISTSTHCSRSMREVRGAKTEIERLRAERNAVSAKFKDATPEEKAELGRQAKEAGARASALEGELADKEAELKALMLRLPGIPYEGAPVGPDESFNKVIRTEGEPPKFDFEPLDHVALIEKNDWARSVAGHAGVGSAAPTASRAALALLETKLMGWALETDRGRRLHADHRAGDRARAGVPQPGPVPRPQGRDLRAAQRRSVAGRDRRSGADLAPFGRDHRGRQVADPLRRFLALLPPRGGERGQGRARAAARPPVRQGRAICDLRGRRGAVGRVARQAARAGRRAAARRSKSPTR